MWLLQYEVVEVKVRGSDQLSTPSMRHLCAEMHERPFGNEDASIDEGLPADRTYDGGLSIRQWR